MFLKNFGLYEPKIAFKDKAFDFLSLVFLSQTYFSHLCSVAPIFMKKFY
jgi:hypothetical protein